MPAGDFFKTMKLSLERCRPPKLDLSETSILGMVTHAFIHISKPHYFVVTVILTKLQNVESLLCYLGRLRHGETKFFLSIQAWSKINLFPEFPKQPHCLTTVWQKNYIGIRELCHLIRKSPATSGKNDSQYRHIYVFL